MRLVGTLQSEKFAFKFYSFLLEQQIQSSYEVAINPTTHKEEFLIWIYEEDLFEKALGFFKEFQKAPLAPPFDKIAIPTPPPPPLIPAGKISQEEETPPNLLTEENLDRKEKFRSFLSSMKNQKRYFHPLTSFVIFIMTLFYFWNVYDRQSRPHPPLTSLEKALVFDYTLYQEKIDALLQATPDSSSPNPEELASIEKIPHWQGFAFIFNNAFKKSLPIPLLASEILPEKIVKEHQWWRLFTPVLLHHDFFHILFNVLLAFALLKQIEDRLSRWKMALLILTIGSFSNTCQYLIGGPNFLGFSGVVCGLVGFIRIRQKIAPWEGYPMSKGFFTFILTYIIAMALLEIGSIELFAFFGTTHSGGIANTAHVTGTLFGAIFGRMPLFARKFR